MLNCVCDLLSQSARFYKFIQFKRNAQTRIMKKCAQSKRYNIHPLKHKSLPSCLFGQLKQQKTLFSPDPIPKRTNQEILTLGGVRAARMASN